MDIIRERIIFPKKSRRNIEMWIIRLLFILGIITFGTIIWGTYEIILAPYDGLKFAAWSGVVIAVDPNGPTANQIIAGDIVQEVEIDVLEKGLSLYRDEKIGEKVILNVFHNDQTKIVRFSLTKEPLSELLSSFVPVFISVQFFTISLFLTFTAMIL